MKEYGVDFLKYWVDKDKGLIYCLSSSSNTESIRKTHTEAHGLLPNHIYEVTEGMEAVLKDNKNLFPDAHYLGAGKVSAADVAAAYEKDLTEQKKQGIFANSKMYPALNYRGVTVW